MSTRPGTPSLLRAINERSALELLVSTGPLTRTRLGELTGLSKVTASQLLSSLQARGLVEVVGEESGGRGPNAEVYGVVRGCAYVAAIDVGPDVVHASVADVTGAVVGDAVLDVAGAQDPVQVVHAAVVSATDQAGIRLEDLHEIVLGTPGLVDPSTGDLGFSFDLPAWHAGLRAALTRDLGRPVVIENDVNLAALAEQDGGAAVGVDDFVLFWVGRGLGMAVVLGGRLHRGASGAAGEIGYLPVPGVPLQDGVERGRKGAFQRLVGAEAVRQLGAEHGLRAADAAAAVTQALADGADGGAFLDALSERLAVGVSAVCAVVDPDLVVLTGAVARAGGRRLSERVAAHVARMVPVRPAVVPTAVSDRAVLRGALLTGLDHAREALFASTADPTPVARSSALT